MSTNPNTNRCPDCGRVVLEAYKSFGYGTPMPCGRYLSKPFAQDQTEVCRTVGLVSKPPRKDPPVANDLLANGFIRITVPERPSTRDLVLNEVLISASYISQTFGLHERLLKYYVLFRLCESVARAWAYNEKGRGNAGLALVQEEADRFFEECRTNIVRRGFADTRFMTYKPVQEPVFV